MSAHNIYYKIRADIFNLVASNRKVTTAFTPRRRKVVTPAFSSLCCLFVSGLFLSKWRRMNVNRGSALGERFAAFGG